MTKLCTTFSLAILLLAKVSFAGEPEFAVPPDFKNGVISFTASAETDVEVTVIDAKDKIVRHLAAGMLGRNAPAPLQSGTLAQKISWDGKNDAGETASGGPFRVRVGLGMKPKLEKILGRDPANMGNVIGLAAAKNGELFVVIAEGFWGRSEVRVYSREGKYLRTVLPYSAKTPAERTESVGHLMVEGERIPIIFNAHSHNLSPMVAGLKHQTLGVHPNGHVILVGSPGTMADHGGPRHLLALHPEGGAPKGTPFVGPQIQRPRGFLGGAGDGPAYYFDHVAVSPDGQSIYFVPNKQNGKDDDDRKIVKARNAVFRLKWEDKELGEAFIGKGAGDEALNDPQGVATDAKGNIYVCDRGNGRVAVFSSEGRMLGAFPVEKPTQVFVHPASNEIYVFSKPESKRAPQSTLFKFEAWSGSAPKQRASLKLGAINVTALDASATPPIFWCGQASSILPVADNGDSFVAGKPIGDKEAGLEYPMFIVADPERNRVIVRERTDWLYQVAMDTGKVSGFPVKGADIALDKDGNMYVMDGYGKNSLSRYDVNGKPMPFKATGTHKLSFIYRAYGPNVGMRGHCVGANGDIYVMASTNYGKPEDIGGHVHVFTKDGTPRKLNLIPGLGYGDCGLGVDLAGNVYVGANVKPAGTTVAEPFVGKVSDKPWLWWNKAPQREAPWSYMFCNPYLFYSGSVLKFPPSGGTIYGHDIARREEPRNAPTMSAANAPKGAASYTSSYLGRDVKIDGALWGVHGVGVIPGSSDGPSPDPGCVCFPSHLKVDPFGRVFAPNVFRFCVEVLDSNGNRMGRIGQYGNADDAGMHFAWPAFVSLSPSTLYVSDPVNRQISVIKLSFSAEKTVAVP